jgi:hypothetical protein
MILTGTLGVRNGQSSIDDMPLAIVDGKPNEFAEATTLVRNAGFTSGDSVSAEGAFGRLGAVRVFFITSVGVADIAAMRASMLTAGAARRSQAASARQSTRRKSTSRKNSDSLPRRGAAANSRIADKRSAQRTGISKTSSNKRRKGD